MKSVLDEIEIGQELSELDKDILFIESVRFEPEFEDYTDFDLLVLRDDFLEVLFEYNLNYQSIDFSRLRTLIHELGQLSDRAVGHFLSSCDNVYDIKKPLLENPEKEYGEDSWM